MGGEVLFFWIFLFGYYSESDADHFEATKLDDSNRL